MARRPDISPEVILRVSLIDEQAQRIAALEREIIKLRIGRHAASMAEARQWMDKACAESARANALAAELAKLKGASRG